MQQGTGKATQKETLACFVIDDPLLQPSYGCLDYRRLLEEMKDHNFFTEIAFIPYNYRRSHKETVRLFADNPDRFAICVHGCYHTRNEFGSVNYNELRELSSTALWRMNQHKKLTGLEYDPIMVFPQGRFSTVAMRALRDEGYFAAVNSTIAGTDSEGVPATELSKPFTRIYHDFPLFLRRYPKDRSLFLQDLASGRPIIIVEHHSVFRNGYTTVTKFVDWLNSQRNIRWVSLFDIAENYLGKTSPDAYRTAPVPAAMQFGASCKVLARRMLSEARDQYIGTNNVLEMVYRKLRG